MSKSAKIRHKQFAKELIKGKSIKKAYLKIYPEVKGRSAEVQGNYLIHNSEVVKQELSKYLDSSDLSIQRLLSKYSSLLEAQRPIVIKDNINYVPDNNTQLETAKEVSKLHRLQQPSTQVNIDARSINVSTPQDLKALQDISEVFQRLNKELLTSQITGEIEDNQPIKEQDITGGDKVND